MVEFKTKLDEKVSKIMQDESRRRSKKIWLSLSIFWIVLGLIDLLLALSDMSEGLMEEYYAGIGMAVFFIVIGVFIYPIGMWIVKSVQKKQDTSLTVIADNTEEVYKFDEEKFYIFTTKGDVYRSAVEAKYEYFNNVVETDEYYLLYISKIQCHVVQKKDLVSGTIEELNNYFSKNLGNSKIKKLIK